MRFFSHLRPGGGRHRHQHCHGHPHSLLRGWDGLGRDRGETAPTPLSPATTEAAETLFVCVGKHCPNGRAVFDALRREAGESKIPVQPCGCLGLCEQGPVAILLPTGSKPPRKGETGTPPLATFFTVTPADAPRIIATMTTRRTEQEMK